MTSRRPADIERTLPHNLEAERSVLGAILSHNDALELVRDVLTADDFYRDAHRRIYRAMAGLSDNRFPIDYVTLREALVRTGELDEVGGPAYVSSLTDGVPRSTNAGHYARIVKDKATLRAVIYAANKMLTDAYEAADDPDDVLERADRELLGIKRLGSSRLAFVREGITEMRQRLEHRVEHKGELLGIDTGYDSINAETLGWQAGDLNIIAARPSIGKTAFVLNSISGAALTQQTRTAFFSLEMRRQQLMDRQLAMIAGVDAHRIRSGQLGTEDFKRITDAIEIQRDLPIAIDDRTGRTAIEVRTICRRMRAEHGLDLVVIDYVQLMPGCSGRRGASRNEEVTDTSHRLKDLADELNVPILLLSQLSRANDKRPDPRPKLSDLRDSGALEQDADMVAFLHRRNHREGGTTAFILEKQRNGPTGSVNLTFDRDLQRFIDGGEDPPEPEPKPRGKRKGTSKADDQRLPVDND